MEDKPQMDASKTDAAAKLSPAHSKPRAAKANAPRTAVLVLGMHRSGTSALTRVLNLLGCDVPGTLLGVDGSNAAGYWESGPISALNDRMLISGGSTWHDWSAFNPNWIDTPVAAGFADEACALVQQEFGDSRLFVLKDPRISQLLPFWQRVLARLNIEPVAVNMLRHPMDVAASLAKRDQFETPYSLMIWLRYTLDAEYGSRGMRRFFTSYDALLGNYRDVVGKSQTVLETHWPRMSERVFGEIANNLSGDLRHHKAGPGPFRAPPYGAPWLAQTYLTLTAWVEAGENPGDHAALDTVRAQFDIAGPAFSRALSDLNGAANEARNLAASLTRVQAEAEITLREQVQVELQAQGAAFATERQKLEAELQAQGAAFDAERQKLEAEVQAQGAAFAAERQKLEAEVQSRYDEVAVLTQAMLQSGVDPTVEAQTALGSGGADLVSQTVATLLKQVERPYLSKAQTLRRQVALLQAAGIFDAEWYLRHYPDVADAGLSPAMHYIQFGHTEGRQPRALTAKAGA